MILAFLMAPAIHSCSSQGNTSDQDSSGSIAEEPGETVEVKQLKVEEYNTFLESHPDVILFDVRTTEERNQGMIPSAITADYMEEGFSDYLATLDKSKTYIVYCASGSRSANASEQMVKMGFEEVYNLEEGYPAWEEVYKDNNK